MEQNKATQPMLVADPQMSKQEFLKSIADTLGSYNWPSGSIECINPDNAKLVYLWGHRFKGNAEGSWTAKVNGSPKITVNNKEVNLTDGTPYSGPLPEFSFDLIVINDNQNTPYWAKDFCKIGWYTDQFKQIDNEVGLDIIGSNAGNPLASWVKNGNEIIDQYALPLATDLSQNAAMAWVALDIVPADVVQQSMNIFNDMKFSSRDVTTTTRNTVEEEVNPVLIPFYVLEFNYEGKTYYIAMMGNGCMKGKVPPVQEPSESVDDIISKEMPDKIKQAKLIKWGWLLAIVLLFVVNLTVAVIALIVWGIAYWLVKKPINDRKKELELQSVSNSQKTAEQLRKQLTR